MGHAEIRGWVAIVAMAGMGCGRAEVARSEVGQGVQVLSARDLDALGPDEVLPIDLTDPDLVVGIDTSWGPIDWARVSLTCPDGTGMPMDFWLALEAHRTGVTAAAKGERLRLLAASEPEPEVDAEDETDAQRDDDCLQCHYCPDGAYVCEWMCGGTTPSSGSDDDEPWRWLCRLGRCAGDQIVGNFIVNDDPQPDWSLGASSPWVDDGEAEPESGGQDGPRDWSAGDVGFGDGGGGGSDIGGGGMGGGDDGAGGGGADDGGGGGGDDGGGDDSGGAAGGGGGGGGGGGAVGGGSHW